MANDRKYPLKGMLTNKSRMPLRVRLKEPQLKPGILTTTFRKLYSIYQHMVSNDEFISAEAIKLLYSCSPKTQATLIQSLCDHNEDLKKRIGIDVARGTWVKFNTLEKKIKDYLRQYKKRADIYLKKLNYLFVTDLEYYLRSIEKTSANTTMKYIRMLKKIMNDVVRKNLHDKNPFQQFKCTFKWPERDVITSEELDIILKKNFSIERLKLVRDFFVVSCFNGCPLTKKYQMMAF